MSSITIDEIKSAAGKISPYIIQTPLLRFRYLEQTFKIPVFLKCENLQITRSFKARGAFNALLTLTQEEKKRGVVTRSSGNFAQAISYASTRLNIPASIVMPANAPKTKISRTKEFGVTPILFGTKHSEAEGRVKEIAEIEGKVVLSPYNHRDVVVGQGTAGLEIFNELPAVRYYISPIGGGGLTAGTSFALKNLSQNVTTIGVEPAGAADYLHYRETGVLEPLPEINTIADGLRAPVVGNIPLPYLDQFVDEAQTTRDETISLAMNLLRDEFGMIVEPSGATSLAYLLENRDRTFDGPVVIMISGANCD
jgi:threonine dehydratase